MRWTVVVAHVLQLQVQLLLILLLCALIALLVVGALKAAPTLLLEQQILAVFTAAGEDVALKQTQIQSLLKDSFGTVLGDKQLEYRMGLLKKEGCIERNKPNGRKWVFVHNLRSNGGVLVFKCVHSLTFIAHIWLFCC